MGIPDVDLRRVTADRLEGRIASMAIEPRIQDVGRFAPQNTLTRILSFNFFNGAVILPHKAPVVYLMFGFSDDTFRPDFLRSFGILANKEETRELFAYRQFGYQLAISATVKPILPFYKLPLFERLIARLRKERRVEIKGKIQVEGGPTYYLQEHFIMRRGEFHRWCAFYLSTTPPDAASNVGFSSVND